MHVFVWLITEADFLSTCFLKTIQNDISKVGKKILPMILSQQSYDLHSEDHDRFRGNSDDKVWII